MKDRRKRTLVIGILCCLLVFMGVGFAVMNATLNINGTATAINTWDVRMTNIEVIEKSEGATNEEETKINEDGISANFKTNFIKPGDYIRYKVTIENKGSIDAVLNDISITLNVSEADKDLFNITDTRPNNQLLEAGTSTTFTIKVEFREDANKMPSGDIEYTVKVDYSQQTGEIIEGEEDWTFVVSDAGEIMAYNYEKGPNVTVPAEVNGTPIKTISRRSFRYKNIQFYQDSATGQLHAVIYEDEPNYSVVKDKALTFFAYQTCGSTACISQIDAATTMYKPWEYNFSEGVTGMGYIDPDPSVDVTNSVEEDPEARVVSVDLSQAIYLEIIGNSSFYTWYEDDSIRIEKVILPENGVLKTIGNSAFFESNLESITIPASVETIGEYAFNHDGYAETQKIKTLIFEENSNLKNIGTNAFRGNSIASIEIPSSVISIGSAAFSGNQIRGELIIPNSVTTIGKWAFSSNQISSLIIADSVTRIDEYAFSTQRDSESNPTLQSVIVKRSKEDFLANVTVGTRWFDNSLVTEPTYLPN